METLDQLKHQVREWVRLDNEIRALNKEIASRRLEKKTISGDLITVMRDNQLDEFDIKDGQLMYVKKHVKKPITQKQLLSILSSYYKNEDKAEEVNTYILENREEVVKESIRRVIKST
jgi:Family of unknown function (DUF5760)